MLMLFETAAGFALFKVLQEGKLTAADAEVGRQAVSMTSKCRNGASVVG